MKETGDKQIIEATKEQLCSYFTDDTLCCANLKSVITMIKHQT